MKWLVNGAEVESLSLDDRGLAYGDGLFETMRAIGAEIPLKELHQKRLLQGCQALDLQLDESLFLHQLDRALSFLEADQSVIKVIVTRAGQASGYAFPDTMGRIKPNIYIRISALSALGDSCLEQEPVLDAQLCDMQLSIQPRLAGIKHLNRLEQVMAATEINASSDKGRLKRNMSKEGILADTEGYIVEAISSNLVIVINGRVYFPDITRSGVQGVMQRYIADLVSQQGVEVDTCRINFKELCQASEILACNSVRGVRNILGIDGHWQSRDIKLGTQLRGLLKQNLNNKFYSF